MGQIQLDAGHGSVPSRALGGAHQLATLRTEHIGLGRVQVQAT